MKFNRLLIVAFSATFLTAYAGSADLSIPVADHSISGTVPVEVPMGGTKVNAKCVAGTASTTTAIDGSFTLTATGLTFPCVLEAILGSPVAAEDRTQITSLIEPINDVISSNIILP